MPCQINRILCLGNTSRDTDVRSTTIASVHHLDNLGLITNDNHCVDKVGVYHTTVADMAIGTILKIADKFDLIIMLDQPRSEWDHWKLLQSTFKTMEALEQKKYNVEFRNNTNIKSFLAVENIIKNNPSWCIYPWINFVSKDDGGLSLCARSATMVSQQNSIDAWKNSTVRKEIQSKMLAGIRTPEHCGTCYKYEDLGIESYRQYESKDWLNQLDISDLQSLEKIQSPMYYEIYWGNKCNLKCRGCVPQRSSAIEKEWQKHRITVDFEIPNQNQYPDVDVVDVDNLQKQSRVYITGGEPVIMDQTLEFMRKCVVKQRTDFELTMSTNGAQIPQNFIDISRNFTNLNMSFSLDGYGPVNDYWRSGSKWHKIVSNMHLMQELGHTVSINTVPGIYNVTNLHLLFEWLDREFPNTAVYLQINHNRMQSAYNHPNHKAVLDSMSRCQNTKVYWSDGKSCRTGIDSIHAHYSKHPDCNIDDLRDFFQFNDRLDQVRKVKLADYIPELEACRYLIGNH